MRPTAGSADLLVWRKAHGFVLDVLALTATVSRTRDGLLCHRSTLHPNDLLATVYYALGIDPDMEIRNHLNQPRELVKGKPLSELWI